MTFTRALLCVRLLYFSPGCISLHAALYFFSLVSFGASNEFVFLKDCFVWLVRTFGFGCFCGESSFFFCASFTYLELLYLRYFSYTVFISTCFNLRYRSVLSRMGFSQFLLLMRQLVEWFGFPSILTWSTDNFNLFLIFRCL